MKKYNRLRALLPLLSLPTFVLGIALSPASAQVPAPPAAGDAIHQKIRELLRANREGEAEQQAILGLSQARVRYDTDKDAEPLRYALTDLGEVRIARRDWGNARTNLEEAAHLPGKTDARTVRRIYRGLGLASYNRGHGKEAAADFRRAIRASAANGDPAAAAADVANLAEALEQTENLDQALDASLTALALREKINDTPDALATSLNNTGGLYFKIGQFDKALAYFQRALPLTATSDPAHLSDVYSNIAASAGKAGDDKAALDAFAQSIALGGAAREDARRAAATIGNRGGLYLNRGDYVSAFTDASQAVTLLEAAKAPASERAEAYHNLATVLHYQKKDASAAPYAERAVAMTEGTPNSGALSSYLTNLGQIRLAQKRTAEAESLLKRALALGEALADLAPDPTQQSAFADQVSGAVAARRILIRQRIAEGRAGEALELVERGHLQGLARQAGQTRADLLSFLSPFDANQLRQAEAARHAASLAERSTDTPDNLTRAQNAQDALERLRESMRARYEPYRHLRGDGGAAFSAERMRVLARAHPDTLYLEWYDPGSDDTGSPLVLFAVSGTVGVRAYPLSVTDDAVTVLVREWRASLLASAGKTERGMHGSAPPSDAALATPEAARKIEAERAARLYAAILGPVDKAGYLSKFARLVFVPDGALAEVPLSALCFAPDGSRVIDRFSVANALSLNTLLWSKEPGSAQNATPEWHLLCVADPFGADGKRNETAARGGNLGALPNARREAEAIVRLFPRGAQLLIGSDAREAAVKAVLPAAAILHFATHGLADRQNGMRSCLMLAPPDPAGNDDGILEAREILGTPLRAELAVLSACDTGLGEASNNEGILGLPWALRAAGCPATVASHWEVDDASTGDLMTVFYTELKKGARKDDALRTAIQSLRNSAGGHYAAPYYWAAFDLYGNTEALSAASPAKPQ